MNIFIHPNLVTGYCIDWAGLHQSTAILWPKRTLMEFMLNRYNLTEIKHFYLIMPKNANTCKRKKRNAVFMDIGMDNCGQTANCGQFK